MGQVVTFPLRGGLAEGDEPKSAPPGTLSIAQNVQQDKAGRVVKRNGYSLIPATTYAGPNLTGAHRLITDGDDLKVLQTAGAIYSGTGTKWKATLRQGPSALATWAPLVDASVGAFDADVAYDSTTGFVCTAWVTGGLSTTQGVGFISLKVSRLATGQDVRSPLMVLTGANGSQPRVLTINSADRIYVFYVSGGNLYCRIALFSTLEWSAAAANMGACAGPYDVATDGTNILVARALAAGANRLTVETFDTVLTSVAGPTAFAGAVGIEVVSVAWAPGVAQALVAWSELTTPTAQIMSITAASTLLYLGPTPLPITTAVTHISAVLTDAQDDLYAVSVGSTTGGPHVITQVYDLSAAAFDGSTQRITYGAVASSKPWADSGSRVFQVFATFPDSDRTYWRGCVVELLWDSLANSFSREPHRVVASLGSAHGHSASFSSLAIAVLPSFVGVSGTVAISAIPRRTESEENGWPRPLGFDLMTFNSLFRPHRAPVTRAPWLDGGTPGLAVDTGAMSGGFLCPPTIRSLTPGGGGSGAMAAGVYQYALVAVWTDTSGRKHRSMPSNILSATAAANGSVAIVINAIPCDGRDSDDTEMYLGSSPTHIEIYRTTVGGSTLYRLSGPPTITTVVTSINTAPTQTFVDTFVDATAGPGAQPLSAQPQLYTAGGELECVAPPSMIHAVEHRGRIYGIVGDKHTVWASKDMGDDPEIAPEFNEVLTVWFSDEKAAVWPLDARLIVAGPDSIDALDGDGPDSTGGANTWLSSRLHSDVGCIEPNSLVTIPQGVMFMSKRGLELIDRGMNVSWIGRGIQDALAAYPTIVAATLAAEAHQVRFCCNNVADTAGAILVYDYVHGAWYVWHVHDGTTASVAFRDAEMIDGVYTILTKNSRVLQEDSATSLDAGTQWVTMSVEFQWFAPSGQDQWGRLKDVQVLGTSSTNHDLTIAIGRDFTAAYEQTKTFLAGSNVTAIGVLEHAKVTAQHQKGQAYRVKITDATPTDPGTYPVTTGKGAVLEALSLHVQPKHRLALTSSGRKG